MSKTRLSVYVLILLYFEARQHQISPCPCEVNTLGSLVCPVTMWNSLPCVPIRLCHIPVVYLPSLSCELTHVLHNMYVFSSPSTTIHAHTGELCPIWT